MRAVILPLAVATIALSGCTALDDLDRRLSSALNPQASAPAPAAEPFQPLPERKPTDVPPPKRQAAPKRIAPAPAVQAPKPEPAPEETAVAPVAPVVEAPKRGKLPESLVGISAEQLRARFGAPEAEIEETPGVSWRYRTPQCTLDIHLFPRVESQGLYALDVSATGLTVDECLAVLTAPPAPPAPPEAETGPDTREQAEAGDGESDTSAPAPVTATEPGTGTGPATPAQ